MFKLSTTGGDVLVNTVHEYSIVQAMFDQIERTAGVHHATAVRRVRVRLGVCAGVDPILLRTAYDTFRAGTVCEDAPIEIAEIPVRWTCPDGHGDLEPGTPLTCAACGRPARLESGDEIVLDQLELEVP